MYHRQTKRRSGVSPRPRTSVDGPVRGSYVITIDDTQHKPLTDPQFNQFAQQILNVVQRVAATRSQPPAELMPLLLMHDIPDELWDAVQHRVQRDHAPRGHGSARLHDAVVRLLDVYARLGLAPIEELGDPSRASES